MNKIRNRHYFFIFQPKKEMGYKSRRFAVSKNKLEQYVGINNANRILREALDLAEDNKRIKLRKHGIIDIYQK